MYGLFDFCTLISLIAYSLFPPFYVCPYFNHREFCVYFPPKNLLLLSIRFLYPFYRFISFHIWGQFRVGNTFVQILRYRSRQTKVLLGGGLLLQQRIQHSVHCKIDILQRFLFRNQKKIVDYCTSIHETKMQIKIFVSF